MQFGVVVNPSESYHALLAGAGIIRSTWIDLDVTRRVTPAAIIDAVRGLAAGR